MLHAREQELELEQAKSQFCVAAQELNQRNEAINNLMIEQQTLQQQLQAKETEVTSPGISDRQREELMREMMQREDEIRQNERMANEALAQQIIDQQRCDALQSQETVRKQAVNDTRKAMKMSKEREHMIKRKAHDLLKARELKHAQEKQALAAQSEQLVIQARREVETKAGAAIVAQRQSDQQVYEEQLHSVHERYREEQRVRHEQLEQMQLELEAARREAVAARRETQAVKVMAHTMPKIPETTANNFAISTPDGVNSRSLSPGAAMPRT